MRGPGASADPMAAALVALRADLGVPGEFPAAALDAAAGAATRRPGVGHVDRTAVAFRTLDPAGSTDLDQAFAVEVAGSDIVLRYAIADVGFFVDPGGPLDAEAWRRGLTIYLPDGRAPLYPPALSEGAASLRPDGPRPAVVFVVRIDPAGVPTLDGVERAVVRSRAQLAYSTVTPADLPAGFAELARRIAAAEVAGGAPRVERPEQELVRDEGAAGAGGAGAWRLVFRPRLPSEEQNAGMSLATNLAVAAALHAARTGLYRVMPEVPAAAVSRLRRVAPGLGFDWPAGDSLAAFSRRLPRDDPRAAAFLLAARRASGGASYAPYREGPLPWHAAMAATYTHATAPLRRLADRYVVEGALAVAQGQPVPEPVAAAYERLPAVMDEAEARAGRVEAAALDLAEAVLLAGRVGEVFDGVIVDEDERGPRMQVADPAVLVRVRAARVDPGDPIRARLVAADPATRTVEFQRVS